MKLTALLLIAALASPAAFAGSIMSDQAREGMNEMCEGASAVAQGVVGLRREGKSRAETRRIANKILAEHTPDKFAQKVLTEAMNYGLTAPIDSTDAEIALAVEPVCKMRVREYLGKI